MKTIIITGPSGSGKTILTNKLSKLFDGTIVISTDSYYRDNYLVRFFSIFNSGIYDRLSSIKNKELNHTLKSIYNKNKVIRTFNYDFKRKKSLQSIINLKYKGDNQFLILEGIFAHRLNLNYHKTINILCKEEKEICFRRRLKRDQLDRNRDIKEVEKRFSQSWHLFYRNIRNYINSNKVMILNPVDKTSFGELITNLNRISANKN